MKRTTLVLDDACMEGIRRLAARERRTMSDIVNELLAEGLRRRREGRSRRRLELPSYDMGIPRVNLADRDALEALMDA